MFVGLRIFFFFLLILASGCGSDGPSFFSDLPLKPAALSPQAQAVLKGKLRQLPDGRLVLAGSQGTPASGIEVRLLGLDGLLKGSVTTDAAGGFRLVCEEVEGRLEARRGGRVLLTRDFSFLPDQEIDASQSFPISRDQAIAAVMRNVPDTALVRATHNPLPPGRWVTEGVSHEGSGSDFQLQVPSAGAYLFFIDFEPLAGWTHEAEIVLVNAQSGEITRHSSQWWPAVDHSPLLCPNDLAVVQNTSSGFTGVPSRTVVQTPSHFAVADLTTPAPSPRQQEVLFRQSDPNDCFAFLLPGTTEDWVTADIEKMKTWCLENKIPERNIVKVSATEDDDRAYYLQARQAYIDLQGRIEARNQAGGHTCLFVFVASHGNVDGELLVSTNRIRLGLQKLAKNQESYSCERFLPIDFTKACELRLFVSCCRGANHIGKWRQALEKPGATGRPVSARTEYELYAGSATGPMFLSSPQLTLVSPLKLIRGDLPLGDLLKFPGAYHVKEWVISVVLQDCQILHFPPPRRTIAVPGEGGLNDVIFDFDSDNPAFQGKPYTKVPVPSPYRPDVPDDPLNERFKNLFFYGQISDWSSTSGGTDDCSPKVSRVELLDTGGFAFSCAWDAVSGQIDPASKSNNTNLASFGVGTVAHQGQATLYTTGAGQVQANNMDSQGLLIPATGSPHAVGNGTIQLTLTPGEDFLYALSGLQSQLAGFRRNSINGELTPLSGSPFATQISPVGLCAFRQGGHDWICTTNGAELRTFQVGTDGALVRTDADLAPVFNVVGSSQQPFIYADTVNNDVRGFRIDPGTGTVAEIAGSPFPRGGTGPLGKMRIHPNAPFLFCPNPGSADVSVLRIGNDGSLTPVAGSPFTTVANPDTVALSPDGDLVYVSSSLGNGISLFGLDLASGALTSRGSPINLNSVSGLFFFP